VKTDAFEQWAATYQRQIGSGTELLWPSETLVRLFKGAYVPGLGGDYAGRKVLDVGFGVGNNLIFLGQLGLALHGTEVGEEICEIARRKLARLGHSADLRVGTNRALPFPDDQFDFLVSWNVIHYENTAEAIREALAEYRRVLKPGGRFFISTTGPEHKILEGSTPLGGHRHLIGREDDHRKGQVFYYFDTAEHARDCFSEYFADVLVGRTHDRLFTATLDWFIVSGVRK
jgi:ubiquinone/menaquinone biosynthesis C-methylase UbiE